MVRICRSGYNTSLGQHGECMNWLIGTLAEHKEICCDDKWLVDSAPVGCAQFGETVRSQAMTGDKNYWGGCCEETADLAGIKV